MVGEQLPQGIMHGGGVGGAFLAVPRRGSMQVYFFNIEHVGGRLVFEFGVIRFFRADEKDAEGQVRERRHHLMHPCGNTSRDIRIRAFKEKADVRTGFGAHGGKGIISYLLLVIGASWSRSDEVPPIRAREG